MALPRTTARAAALTLAAGLLSGIAGASPAQAAEEPVAGGLAASPADSLFPNQGNSGYDAQHYDIDFRIDIGVATNNNVAATTTLSDSTTTIEATTTGAPLSSFSLDFQGTTSTLANSTFNVDAVTVNGQPAAFERIETTTTANATTDQHKLVVTPAAPVDGAFTTVVTTSGRPVIHTDTDGSLEGWNNTVDGASFVNQPIGAMTLFPHNNTPRDKATYTWTVDAPTTSGTSAYAQAGGRSYPVGVVSNGELESRTPSADGTRTTWVWDQEEQQASELSLFSIGRYDIYTSDITLASGRTIPEWTFIDPAASVAQQTATLGTRAQLKQMLDFYETRYGPYPGNSTGLVTDNTTGINYALETQDRPFSPNTASRGTTYHEIMHQWWGDNVSPTDWNDITLNEGPATYAEYQLPAELIGSVANTTTEQGLYNFWNTTGLTGVAGQTWAVPPAAMTTASQLFGAPTYNKGGMAMEALRTSIGAADFATLMRQYQLQYGGGQVAGRRTAAFEDLAESISGRDLTAFFQTWFYTAGKPAWPVKLNLDVAGPTTQVNAGDAASWTVTARNTGKVAMPVGTVVSIDLADVLDDATIGTLPANTTLDGTTLTWAVPATALAATAGIAIPVTVDAGTTGERLKPVVRATTLGSTCLDCSPSVTIGTAPISPAPVPTVSGGTPTVGVALTADTTGWADGTAFTYQWSIDGTPVPGATSATYTPDVSVLDLPVTVRVTGSLAGFNPTSVTSAATAAGVRGTPISSTPTVSGTPKIGEKLTVDPGTWQPGTVFTYQWRANGTAISGATGPVYTPAVATQVGQTIDVVVTGTRAGYLTTSRTSAATTAVGAGNPLVLVPEPALVGTPKVGVVYQPTIGLWDEGVTLAFQWAANGTNVAGSAGTGASITPTAAQLGQVLTLRVTGTRPGSTPVVYTTAASPAVVTGTQVLQPTPTITGTPRAQTAVTGVQGAWDAGTTRTNKWYADGLAIAGATGTTYTPTIAQIGQVLTYEVTSTRAGYATVVRTSEGRTIVGLAQVLSPTPTIDGTPKVGVGLTAVPGTWDDGTTLAFQWLAGGTPVDGATSSTYTPDVAQVGEALAVRVTSTKADFEDVVRTSAPTAAVAKGDLTSTPVPTIAGTPKVGVELTALPGAWDVGTVFSYQWYADGTPVDGATSSTWTPGPGRVGSVVTVAVSGARTGFEEVARSSAATAEVAPGDLLSTPLPTITGTPQVGASLSAVPGTWDDGVELGYQWFADGDAIDGATSSTYVPGPGRAGDVLTVAVTGTKAGYQTVVRTSAATTAVLAGDLVSTPVPTITGTPKVGVELTAVPGTWDAGSVLGFQWLADGQAVAGATAATFTPGAAQQGDALTVEVTGTLAGFLPVTRVSLPTAAVALGDPVATPVPSITGTPKVGVALSAVPGTWDAGTALGYQWLADGQLVPGATAATFTPGAAQQGDAVTVAVTGTRTGFLPVTRTSVPTAAVVPGDLVATPVPSVTGTPRVDQELRADPGAWDEGTAVDYRWTRDGTTIAGATGSTYRATAADLGHSLAVVVTGGKGGYTSVSRTSAGSVVVAATQVLRPRPAIAGKARVGRTLTARPGAHDPGVTLAYLWKSGSRTVGTSRTLVLRKKLLGSRIRLTTTATKPGYTTVVTRSERTGKVLPKA